MEQPHPLCCVAGVNGPARRGYMLVAPFPLLVAQPPMSLLVAQSPFARLQLVDVTLTDRRLITDLTRRQMVGVKPSKSNVLRRRLADTTNDPCVRVVIQSHCGKRRSLAMAELLAREGEFSAEIVFCSTWKLIAGTRTMQKHLAMITKHRSRRS